MNPTTTGWHESDDRRTHIERLNDQPAQKEEGRAPAEKAPAEHAPEEKAPAEKAPKKKRRPWR